MYSPIDVLVGGHTHRLALHRAPGRDWSISDPVSGFRVVYSVYSKAIGRAATGKHLALKEIRPLAIQVMERLVASVGAEQFNAMLGQPRLAPAHCVAQSCRY